MDLQKEVDKLQATLTGNIFDDGETMQKIYELKKIINPRIELHPDLDDDEGCEMCSG